MVDSQGAEIGVFLDNEEKHVLVGPVLMQGTWLPVVVIVRYDLFAMTAQGGLLFEATDCSSAPIVVSAVGEDSLLRGVPFGPPPSNTGPGAVLHYPTEVGIQRTLRSVATSQTPAGCSAGKVFTPPYTCCETLTPPVSFHSSPTGTLDLGGFVPPFVVSLD